MVTSNDRPCYYCGKTGLETRPYAPGGAQACFPCMTATPEREASAKAAFHALVDAAGAVSPTNTVILTPRGPDPFDATGL